MRRMMWGALSSAGKRTASKDTIFSMAMRRFRVLCNDRRDRGGHLESLRTGSGNYGWVDCKRVEDSWRRAWYEIGGTVLKGSLLLYRGSLGARRGASLIEWPRLLKVELEAKGEVNCYVQTYLFLRSGSTEPIAANFHDRGGANPTRASPI